jgi:hypothetical protein
VSEPMPPDDQAAGDALAQRIAGDMSRMMRGEAKRRGGAAIFSAAAMIGVAFWYLFRARASDRLLPVLVAIGVLLAGVLAAASLRLRRWMPGLLVAALLVTLGFAALASGRGLYAPAGLDCAAIEWLFAALTAAPAVLALKKNGDPIDPWRVMAWTALGGSIGAACLWIICPAREAIDHALVFHTGALIVAVLLMRAWAVRAAR